MAMAKRLGVTHSSNEALTRRRLTRQHAVAFGHDVKRPSRAATDLLELLEDPKD